MGKQIYGLKRFYTSNEDLSQIRFREKIMNLVEYNRIRYAVNVFFFIFVEVCKMFMTDDNPLIIKIVLL